MPREAGVGERAKARSLSKERHFIGGGEVSENAEKIVKESAGRR